VNPVTPSLSLPPVEGVYLNMPDEVYHGAPALGSSDFSTLAKDPASWWYQSAHNPEREHGRSAAHFLRGRALHALVLQGEAAYDAAFSVEPDEEDPGMLRNLFEVKDALSERGVQTFGEMDAKVIYAKARAAGLAPRVLALARADHDRARSGGRTAISLADDKRLRRMAQLIRGHADLGEAIRSGLPEVSVFWRRPGTPGVLLRARFDLLLPEFIVDLKSLSNARGHAPERAALNSIADYEYDLQAPHYHEGRTYLRQFFSEGRVYAWTPDGASAARGLKSEMGRLQSIVAADAWRWVWIFYQLLSHQPGNERAPVIVPYFVDLEGDWFDAARATIERALGNYTRFVDQFGLNQPWSVIRAIESLPAEPLARLAHRRKDPA
jgi:hypothetical protein